jgi:PAS domain-containing protein
MKSSPIIEDLKCAEDALKWNEQKLRLIVDTIPGLVCTMSAAGEVQLLNRMSLSFANGAPMACTAGSRLERFQQEKRKAVLPAGTCC